MNAFLKDFQDYPPLHELFAAFAGYKSGNSSSSSSSSYSNSLKVDTKEKLEVALMQLAMVGGGKITRRKKKVDGT